MSDNINPGDLVRIDYPDGSAVKGVYVKQFAYLPIVHVGGSDYHMRPGTITVLKRAPARFTVGTWVRGKDSFGWIGVVTEIVDDTVVKVRNLKNDFSKLVSTSILTALDGPPEPPDGSVYVIGTIVYERYGTGHYQTGRSGPDRWDRVIGRLDNAELATLRILGDTGRNTP